MALFVCMWMYIGQINEKKINKRYFKHLDAYKELNIYKSNLARHAINTGRVHPDINNITLIRHVPHKGTVTNTWENRHVYKHKIQSKLFPNKNQYKTRKNFETLNIGNTQNTNLYITSDHNNTKKPQSTKSIQKPATATNQYIGDTQIRNQHGWRWTYCLMLETYCKWGKYILIAQ